MPDLHEARSILADLYREVDDGNFRQDLLYRINTVEIKLPPLRERQEDITILADHFLKIFLNLFGAVFFKKRLYQIGGRFHEYGAIHFFDIFLNLLLKIPQFEKNLFEPIIRSINSAQDPWLTAADFRSYVDAQERVAAAFRDTERWTRMSILNTASSGKFSTDRTMLDYNRAIWRLSPVAPTPL